MKTKHLIITALALAGGFAGHAQIDESRDSGNATRPGEATPSRNASAVQPQPGGGMGGFGGGAATAPQPPRPMSSGFGGYGGSGFGGGYGSAGAPPGWNADSSFSQRLQAIVGRAGGERSADQPLLILSSDSDPATREKLHEDMVVMAHILQKAVGGAGGGLGYSGRAMGVDLVFAHGGEPGRDLYLEGYGAVFLATVPFPLLPTPGKPDKDADPTAADTDWEKAKRELHGQPVEPLVTGIATEPYREERVAQLQNAILDALKNASNIRELKPEESVTVCVIGPAGLGTAPPQPLRPWRALRSLDDAKLELGGPPHLNQTVLTLRVTKADVEAFAKGKSDLESFRKKVQISSYGA